MTPRMSDRERAALPAGDREIQEDPIDPYTCQLCDWQIPTPKAVCEHCGFDNSEGYSR